MNLKKWKIIVITAFLLPLLSQIIAQEFIKVDIFSVILNAIASLFDVLFVKISLPIWLILSILVFVFIFSIYFYKPKYHRPFFSKTIPIFSGKKKSNSSLERYSAKDIATNKFIPEDIRLILLGYQNSGGLITYKKSICSAEYEPGTFRLSEIGVDTKFLTKTQSFEQWATIALEAELLTLQKHYKKLIKHYSNQELILRSIQVLEARTNIGHTLKHDIWYQEYSDVLRRIILFCSGSHPDIELELFPNLTVERGDFIFDVLTWLESNIRPDLRVWLQLSIAAGLLGVDEKSSHTAASEIDKDFAVSLDSSNEKRQFSISRVGASVHKLANSKSRIDASEWLFQYLKFSQGIKVRFVSFPDDYIETIFLLKFYEELLKEYDNIEIDCIPRMIRCGNDARYEDFDDFFHHFKFLKDSTRFRVHNNGPKLGTVNLTKLHPTVLNLLEESDFVDARGARNHEMMQGIKKDVFFGFMVCREFSESITGLYAKNTPFIYIKQSAGERSFSGFRQRSERKIDGKLFCKETAADRKNKWEGGHLAQYENWTESERSRYKINQKFYSKGASDFHKKYGDLLEKEVKQMLHELQGRILVLGCGSGKEVGYLCEKNQDAIGLDFSVEAIWLAKQRYPHLWDRFFVDDFYNTVYFGQGEFDAIVANATFVHLLKREHLSMLMSQVHSRLRKDGKFFIRLIQKEGVKEEYDSNLFNAQRWFVYYTTEELKEIISKIGFEIIKHDVRTHVQHESVHWLSYILKKV